MRFGLLVAEWCRWFGQGRIARQLPWGHRSLTFCLATSPSTPNRELLTLFFAFSLP